jgi:hypothetical protein
VASYFDRTHTVANNNKLVPTTLIANLVVASVRRPQYFLTRTGVT